LGDVCGSLPGELCRLGHGTVVFLPGYRQALNYGGAIESTDIVFDIPIGGKIASGRLLKTTMPDESCTVYLVQQAEYFDRDGLYQQDGSDYPDNCERFVFFSRAVLESIRQLNLEIDVIHCNDWQTGLIPAYLKTEYAAARGYESIASLVTIHNLEYQGVFWHWDMLLTGLDWKYFNWQQMEYFGQLNLLKTGLVFADAINTVSPTYAEEIQSYERGCGLEGVLRDRANVLRGILNGVNYDVWNPAVDDQIASTYDASNWREGKPKCKRALQETLGLPTSDRTPLLGAVGRLARQKGWDLILETMRRWLGNGVDAQWAILGSGEPQYQQELVELAEQYPDRVGVRVEFSNALSHQIEAGSDMFLMPSLYEPCGLNQMYSLKYGTPPVVRATGGLADTITDGQNGFVFDEFSTDAFEQVLGRACDLYRHQQDDWDRLIDEGINQDWSWTRSAREYLDIYQLAIDEKRSA